MDTGSYDVLRGGSVVMVGNRCFSLAALTRATYEAVKRAGSQNPAYDMPPWFYSGSEYGREICDLGVPFVVGFPDAFAPEYVPKSTPSLCGRPPIWPEVFGRGQSEAWI